MHLSAANGKMDASYDFVMKNPKMISQFFVGGLELSKPLSDGVQAFGLELSKPLSDGVQAFVKKGECLSAGLCARHCQVGSLGDGVSIL